MKLFASLSAALVVAAAMAPGVASADRVRVVETSRTVHTERDRNYRDGRDDRGRWGWRKECHMERHHGHRSRICKNVRYRR